MFDKIIGNQQEICNIINSVFIRQYPEMELNIADSPLCFKQNQKPIRCYIRIFIIIFYI